MNNRKFAALGHREELLPLKSLGFDIYECVAFEKARDIISKLSSQDYELVIVSESVVENNQNEFLDMVRSLSLTILVLPEYKMKKDIAKEIIKKVTREAVGF